MEQEWLTFLKPIWSLPSDLKAGVLHFEECGSEQEASSSCHFPSFWQIVISTWVSLPSKILSCTYIQQSMSNLYKQEPLNRKYTGNYRLTSALKYFDLHNCSWISVLHMLCITSALPHGLGNLHWLVKLGTAPSSVWQLLELQELHFGSESQQRPWRELQQSGWGV